MKKGSLIVLSSLGLVLIFFGFVFGKDETLSVPITELFSENKYDVKLGERNAYYRDYDFSYVQNTNSFIPQCKQDLLNIYYTIINAGKDEFTFYCSRDYEQCITDLETIANDKASLSLINNYVHPYNEFKRIETVYDTAGKVTVKIEKVYSSSDIEALESQLNIIEGNIIKADASPRDNIKAIHDYITTNTKYDVDRRDKNNSIYKSDTAYGPVIQGYGICSGYADAVSLLLERLNIENYRIASDEHVWNAVHLDDNWLHLDLTWDDPVLTDGFDITLYDYYLISTKELLELDATEHTFNQTIFAELKEAN